jgi:hypothetical protein
MRIGLALLASLVICGVARAECPTDLEQLRAGLDAAEAAYGEFDFEAYSAGLTALRADLACLSEVATPEDVARVHLADALDCWVRREALGEETGHEVEQALRGLLAVRPDFEPPDDLMPDGGQLRVYFYQARGAGPGALEPFEGEGWSADGGASQGVPLERDALVQYSGEAGVQSWYLAGGGLPSSLEQQLKDSRQAARKEPAAEVSEPRTSRSLLIAGLATGAAAGAGLGVAAWSRGVYLEQPDPDQASSLDGLNRAAGVGGYALAGVAGGLGLTAVLVGRW